MKSRTREYLGLPVPELENRLRSAQDELTNIRFALATRKMSNYARLKILRKEIARLKFFIDEQRREA
jgi:ribosomal protein L29